jgi:endogenous inhibitor of DNA gyrase (YacG/DUF329 family)
MRTVPCPRCGKAAVLGPDNKWRPFCSERCRIIDLGEWASESYRVPIEDQQDPSDAEDDPPKPKIPGS